MPGPYIDELLKTTNAEGIFKMVEGMDDKTAYAECVLSFQEDKKSKPKFFTGRQNGKIVAPREDESGWSQIFETDKPDGHLEMAYDQLAEYLNKHSFNQIIKGKNAGFKRNLDPNAHLMLGGPRARDRYAVWRNGRMTVINPQDEDDAY